MGGVFFQDTRSDRTAYDALCELLADPDRTRARIAVAFASAPGVDLLCSALALRDPPMRVELCVGLDGGITRKAGLERLLEELDGVRTVTTPARSGMFHPKAFVTDDPARPVAPRALIGSANLTEPALTGNREIAAIVDLDAPAVEAWEAWWRRLGGDSRKLTASTIAAYRERRPPPRHSEVIADEVVENAGDDQLVSVSNDGTPPAAATGILCLDVGMTGASSTQLELPKPTADFFHKARGQVRDLTLRYGNEVYDGPWLDYYEGRSGGGSGNSMWRINWSALPYRKRREISNARTLTFRRLGGDLYEMELVGPERRAELLARARELNTYGRTVTREYGWV